MQQRKGDCMPEDKTSRHDIPKIPTMTLEEARGVIQTSSYSKFSSPKSLGELLDKGYLTRVSLERMIQRKDDEGVSEAAAVLLSSMPSEKSMSSVDVEDILNIPWPFNYPEGCKGKSMYVLVCTRQVNLSSLGYAAHKALDEQVRLAAAMHIVRLLTWQYGPVGKPIKRSVRSAPLRWRWFKRFMSSRNKGNFGN